MYDQELRSTAQALVAEGKGILAADESTGTITRRLAAVGVESTEESRRDYRTMLFTTQGIEEYLSGIIMYDETIRQTASNGTPFPQLLSQKGIMPGIKVDTGAKDLAGFPGEKITEGLDGLRGRLVEYKDLGARFAKWRAVITIGDGIPSDYCMFANAHALARYAALCQEAGLVPIVEPEVTIDGDHDIKRCEEASTAAWNHLFAEVKGHRVLLEGMLLKPNMVISGKSCPVQAGVEEVAESTIRSLLRTVPAAVPGVVFLSGGQSPERATQHLNLMNTMGKHPWEVSFSFARALQGPAMETWRGEAAYVAAAQKAFHHRTRLAAAARQGSYSPEMEATVA